MSDKDPRDATPSRFTGSIGLILLGITFVVCTIISLHNARNIAAPDHTVLRIAHWQLEQGYRQGMQAVIDDYEKLHPGVQIVQIALPDKYYAQLINTQLISETAPDICEMGTGSDLMAKDENTVRYFVPLSNHIVSPNPYNKGTDLQNVAWKDTLLDGMRGGFREGLAEYYGVPTTLVSMRLYYNKQLLKAATGSDAPPKSFGEWMHMCEQVREYAATHDDRILPVISCYDIASMQNYYDPVFTSGFAPEVDLDLDGNMSALETYIAYLQGKVSLTTPAVKAIYETCRKIGDQMQQGFSAIDRQQGQFRFCNGQAAFMWSGSWDASGTAAQTKANHIDIGIFRLPLPAPGEPNGQYVNGQPGELVLGQGNYGIYKGSQHQALAMDFLMFLSSQKENEKFNQIAEWPPMTLGAKPSALMEPFTVDRRGYNAKLQFNFGTRVNHDAAGKVINYYQGDATFDDFVNNYDSVIRDPWRGGDWAWWKEYDDRARDVRSKERVLAQQQTLELLDPDTSESDRYSRSLLQQVIRNDALDYPYLFQKYRGEPMPHY